MNDWLTCCGRRDPGLYCFRRGRDFVEAALATHARPHDTVEQRTKYYVASVVDSIIRVGGRVDAVMLTGSWSVRQLDELKPFREAVFAQVGRAEQMAIYSDMRTRNAQHIASDGFAHDEALAHDRDWRRCVAVYVLASPSNFIPSSTLEQTLEKLSDLMAAHVVYRALESEHPGLVFISAPFSPEPSK